MCHRLLASIIAAIVLCTAVPGMAAEPVFSDSFRDLNNWTKANGSTPLLGQLKAGETLTPCMLLGNGIAKADLPRKLNESFVLSFRAGNNKYQRGLWVGLFNDDGSKGYAAFWDASSEEAFHGQGNVSIVKFDLAKPVTWADRVGTVLTKRVESGQKAVGGWPALLQLSWDKTSHTLILTVNGAERGRVVDSSLTSFTKVYVCGNERSVFTDLRVTTRTAATTQPAR